MAVSHKVVQQRNGTNHSAVFVEDNVSQKRISVAIYDPVRSQFSFSPADHDVVLNAADKATILSILNSLQR
jgi:hypothetical protein